MDILNTTIFYILTLICLIGAAFCLFQKNTFNFCLFAILSFSGFAGLFFLLNAFYIACAEILLLGLAMTVIILFSTVMTNIKNDKSGIIFNLKTLFAPILNVIFLFLTVPFILYQFKGYKTLQSFNMTDFSLNLYKNNPPAFELIGILIFTVIVGITAIITFKTTHKTSSLNKSQNGENI